MKKKGFTLVELLVVIAIIALLMGILMPALARVRQLAFRMTCGTNLSGIGKAMLIYANDYEDELPRAGGRTNNWSASLQDYAAQNRQQAYGLTGGAAATGTVTTSSSLYLLVKYAEVTPKSFVCKGESDTSEFKLADWQGIGNLRVTDELIDVWDFGMYQGEDQNTSKHCSYAYHAPFSSFALTVSHEPTMAVAADRNPWCDPEVDTQAAWQRFQPDLDNYSPQGTQEQAKEGNSRAHQMEGQNVLYLDSHVSFEKRSFTGIENDNIYTVGVSGQKMLSVKGPQPPVVYNKDQTKPVNRRDSVLVQENGTAASSGSSGGSSRGGR